MSVTTSLPGPNDHFISLSKAVDMTTDYRANKESILATTYQNQDILPLSETFHRNALDTLLAQEGCEGIRVYPGMDENLKIHMLMVGVTEDNEDIIPETNLTENEFTSIIEEAHRCPPLCAPASPLNE